MIDFEKALRKSWRQTREQLFQPFDVRKWLVLGFTAFLASLIGGGASGAVYFSPPLPGTEPSVATPNFAWAQEIASWGPAVWLAILGGVALVVCGVLIVLLWVGTRGQFVFLDNVRNNCAELRRPWRAHRERGNSFFKLYVWIGSLPVAGLLVVVLLAVITFLPALIERRMPSGGEILPWIAVLAGLGLVGAVWALLMMFYRDFGVPMMLVSGCTAADAFWRVGDLLKARPADCAIYALLRVAMVIVFGITVLFAGLVTCCVGFLPYVSTVITLPLWVFRQSFTLDCLAQLAPELALWPSEVEIGRGG